MPIVTGSHPKALIGATAPVVEQANPTEPLIDVTDRFVPKKRKPPKIKKRAFGESAPGAAFRK